MADKSPLTHLNQRGEAHMVDIGDKKITKRRAVAEAMVSARTETIKIILEDGLKKGDALALARVAGIMGAKKTSDLIPLCHPISLTKVELEIVKNTEDSLLITAIAETTGRTGVEMEALSAVSIAALTLYDMAKAIDRAMVISGIRLIKKSGGKSGDFVRES
ncbi:Cyclic pyranopterin monophosphate synthase accessory protein [hydrothermal vent metagenome]|uniref:cyclic pyranopterin monophosphate synthase n=1 Tax=hydrothermal vent metagenome TaxID=652676 RepID=A0A3B0UFK1_9ZZZZ